MSEKSDKLRAMLEKEKERRIKLNNRMVAIVIRKFSSNTCPFSGFHPSSALRRLTHRLRWLTESRPSILTRPSNRPLRTPGALRT